MRAEIANLLDVQSVMNIVELCIAHMRSQKIFQWDETYPNLGVVEADVRSGELFVVRAEGVSIAAVCLNEKQAQEYRSLPWQYNAGRSLVVHRLCVHPEWHRRGIGKFLMDFAEHFGRENNFSSIRLDTYSGNPGAVAFYERLGYQRVGNVRFPRRDFPFPCFEKIII